MDETDYHYFFPAVDEICYVAAASDSSGSARPITRSLTFGSDREYRTEPFDSERLPVTLSPEIQRFLHVANLIEREEPRTNYLCRFYAFEIVVKLDPNCIGRGVQQFRTSLLKRLEQDNDVTLFKREAKSDMLELRRVYLAYDDSIIKNVGIVDIQNEEKMSIARRVAQVLYEY